MQKDRFEAVLILLVPQVIGLITEKHACDEETAIKSFYNSELYASLEDEATKVWHLSPLTLFYMFDEEMKTGTFEFPEEA